MTLKPNLYNEGSVYVEDLSGKPAKQLEEETGSEDIEAMQVEVYLLEDSELPVQEKRTRIEFPAIQEDSFALGMYSNMMGVWGIKQDYLVQRENKAPEVVDSPSDIDLEQETGEVRISPKSGVEGADTVLHLNGNDNKFKLEYGEEVSPGEPDLGLEKYVEALHEDPVVREESSQAASRAQRKADNLAEELEENSQSQPLLSQAEQYLETDTDPKEPR